MKDGKLHIGTSGWNYSDWKGLFYPEDVKSADWLSYYATQFDSTEVNSSFYHLPRATTIANWVLKVPAGFTFCVKVSRYITHIKRLKITDEDLAKFMAVFEPMKSQCGPVLIQLPPSLKFDPESVRQFFTLLQSYNHYRFAIEPRHNTWLQPEAIALLKEHNIAWVISQSGAGFPYEELVTAPDVYVRLHGPKELYFSSYSDTELRMYADKIKRWLAEGHNVWVYFNNTGKGIAIGNAKQLMSYVGSQD